MGICLFKVNNKQPRVKSSQQRFFYRKTPAPVSFLKTFIKNRLWHRYYLPMHFVKFLRTFLDVILVSLLLILTAICPQSLKGHQIAASRFMELY